MSRNSTFFPKGKNLKISTPASFTTMPLYTSAFTSAHFSLITHSSIERQVLNSEEHISHTQARAPSLEENDIEGARSIGDVFKVLGEALNVVLLACAGVREREKKMRRYQNVISFSLSKNSNLKQPFWKRKQQLSTRSTHLPFAAASAAAKRALSLSSYLFPERLPAAPPIAPPMAVIEKTCDQTCGPLHLPLSPSPAPAATPKGPPTMPITPPTAAPMAAPPTVRLPSCLSFFFPSFLSLSFLSFLSLSLPSF